MKFRTLLAITAAAAAALPMATSARTVRVYTQKIDARDICGTTFGRYGCSTTARNMNLRKADIALAIRQGAPNHFQVLGKYYTGLSGDAPSLSTCGPGDANPFDTADTADQTRPTSFTFKKRSDTKVSADLKADVVKALVAANVPAAALEGLKADFSTTYKRIAGANHNIAGKYYRMQLEDSVIQGIKNPETTNRKAKACGDELRRTPRSSLIWSIAVIELDEASFSKNVASDAAADFAAKVSQKAPGADIASIKANVTSAVKKELTVELGREHRVISWDYLQL